MLLKLLNKYLELADRPILKAFISTALSLVFCALPILLMIAGSWFSYLIIALLKWLAGFLGGWLGDVIAWMLAQIAWIIENLSLLAMPALIVLVAILYLHFYRKRASIKVMITTYIFKRATEPLLALNFAALVVKCLIGFEVFYSLDHLLNDMGLSYAFGSGQVVLVTLLMWFMLTLGLHAQLYIIRKENAAAGDIEVLEKIRLLLLEWIAKNQDHKAKSP